MRYLIRRTKETKGFKTTTKVSIVNADGFGKPEEFIPELKRVLGVESWNDIPIELRKTTGFGSTFYLSDLEEDSDWLIFQICLEEAKKRTKKVVKEHIIELE
jgi:hypothetical protein